MIFFFVDVLAASVLVGCLLPLLALLAITGRLALRSYDLKRITGSGAAVPRRTATVPTSTVRVLPDPWSLELWLQLAMFMLKTYGSVALIAWLYGAIGSISAFACLWLVSAIRRDPVVLGVLSPPTSALDAVFFFGLLPCLCLPAILMDNLGGGAFVYLYIAFFWQRAPTAYALALVALLLVYAYARSIMDPLAHIGVSDVAWIIGAAALLSQCPRRLTYALFPLALARSDPARMHVISGAHTLALLWGQGGGNTT